MHTQKCKCHNYQILSAVIVLSVAESFLQITLVVRVLHCECIQCHCFIYTYIQVKNYVIVRGQ